MAIETRLLQQFVAVAEALHFSRAAEKLHMAQPPLSQAIRRLEDELGYALFERTNRRVTLTPAGSSFLDAARSILASIDESVARTRCVAQGIEGHLTMTFINIVNYPPLLRALRNLRLASPKVSFTMKEATTHEQVEALERGDADIGFMRAPGRSAPNLCFESVLREPICVVLPAGHRFEKRASVWLADLKDDAFVASPRPLGQGFHDQMIRLCQAAGFEPHVVQHARQLHTVIALVASGFGIALMPASLAMAARDDIVFRPIAVDADEDLKHLDLFMAWHTGRDLPIRDRLMAEVLAAMPLR